jgi:hypothetical protein
MSGLIHTGLGSSYIIAHVLHSPPPPPANSFVIGPAVINTHTDTQAQAQAQAQVCECLIGKNKLNTVILLPKMGSRGGSPPKMNGEGGPEAGALEGGGGLDGRLRTTALVGGRASAGPLLRPHTCG